MLKIGVIDSGIGGFSVVKGMIDAGIKAEYIYVFDNKYHPYGGKSKGELSAIAFMNVNMLVSRGVDIVVVACNTLTSSSINELRKMYDIPIIGVEPAVKPCAGSCIDIVVMATPYTLKGEKLSNMLLGYTEENFYYPNLDNLAFIIENNIDDREYMSDYLTSRLKCYSKCDGLVLGCTHYNFIVDIIKTILPQVKIFSSTEGVVRRVYQCIKQLKLSTNDDSAICIIPTNGSLPISKLNYLKNYTEMDITVDDVDI